MNNLKELSQLFYSNEEKVNQTLIQESEFQLSDRTYDCPSGEIWLEDKFLPWVKEEIEILSSLIPSKIDIIANATDVIPFKKGSYVYFLILDEKLVYIGQTVSVAARLATHVDSLKLFNKAYIMDIPRNERMAMEAMCISKYLPLYNKTENETIFLLRQCINLYLSQRRLGTMSRLSARLGRREEAGS